MPLHKVVLLQRRQGVSRGRPCGAVRQATRSMAVAAIVIMTSQGSEHEHGQGKERQRQDHVRSVNAFFVFGNILINGLGDAARRSWRPRPWRRIVLLPRAFR